jgi:hypothetical protein
MILSLHHPLRPRQGCSHYILFQSKLIPSSRFCFTTKTNAPINGVLVHVSMANSPPSAFTHMYTTSTTKLLQTLQSSTIITNEPLYTTSNISHPPTTHTNFPAVTYKTILNLKSRQHACASPPAARPVRPHRPGN